MNELEYQLEQLEEQTELLQAFREWIDNMPHTIRDTKMAEDINQLFENELYEATNEVNDILQLFDRAEEIHQTLTDI